MLNQSSNRFDIVVIGSGIAGLSHILYSHEFFSNLSANPSMALVCKSRLQDTNTYWAQGGIAGVTLPTDNTQNHIEDTLLAGNFMNNEEIVKKVVNAAPELINDLIRWGVSFDKNEKGELIVTKEGGHSHHRILHHKDETGKSIQQTLIKNLPNDINVFENHLAYEINIDDHGAFHISLINKKENNYQIVASQVVIATGGVGMLFDNTTNAEIATGDGLFLAHSVGATTSNLSFIQFHPTGLFNPGEKSFLITEALRGEGAVLRNLRGELFMHNYDTRKELAPRDVVTMSIFKEMILQNIDHVLLDCTMISHDKWKHHFPNIFEKCMSIGINPLIQPIPVIPVQHYLCGGIDSNENGMTSVRNLYAIGEVANTGLHGSNRLASNSLLEGLAFGKFSAKEISNNFDKEWKFNNRTTQHKNFIKSLDKKLLQKLMSTSMGVIKNDKELIKTKFEIENHFNDSNYTGFRWEVIETNMMFSTSKLIIDDAIKQSKNTGVFFKIYN